MGNKGVIQNLLVLFLFVCLTQKGAGQTVVLWCFDEQKGLYPSSVISDQSENDYPLVIGPGGMIVDGKYGNALEPLDQPAVTIPDGEVQFGLKELPVPAGRPVPQRKSLSRAMIS